MLPFCRDSVEYLGRHDPKYFQSGHCRDHRDSSHVNQHHCQSSNMHTHPLLLPFLPKMSHIAVHNVSCLIRDEATILSVTAKCALCTLAPDDMWCGGDTFTNITIRMLALSVAIPPKARIGTRCAISHACVSACRSRTSWSAPPYPRESNLPSHILEGTRNGGHASHHLARHHCPNSPGLWSCAR